MFVDENDLKLMADSGLFDSDWYCHTYPDVLDTGLSPAEHFIWIGGRLGRNPCASFDTKAYLASNPEAGASEENPLMHYLRTGGMISAAALLAPNLALPSFAPGKQYPFRPHLQRLLDRTRDRIVRERNGEYYEQIERLIDLSFYVQRYPDLVRGNINPVQHYLNHGRRERRQLWPHFSPKFYIATHPDLAKDPRDPHVHYIEEGRRARLPVTEFSGGSDAFEQYCLTFGYEPAELERASLEKQALLRDRLERGTLGQMVANACKIEPLIAQGWLASLTPGISPLRSETLLRFMTAMKRMHIEADYRTAKAIVLIPWCHVSGASRVAGFLADALSRIHGPEEIVIIRTETSEMDFSEWFPAGARHIDFASHAHGLKDDPRHRLLISLIRSLKPHSIFNVNSLTFWDALAAYGTPLSCTSDLHSYLFCSEVDIYGNISGYPIRRFHSTFGVHKTFLTDSDFLQGELTQRFLLPKSQQKKLLKLPSPLSPDIKIATAPGDDPLRRRQVFWAGRFDRQKRVDIVYQVAQLMPDVLFRMWGTPVLDRSVAALATPPNVQHEGLYQTFNDLPLSECDAWLYTSEWDGVPNILLDVAAAGIPVAGSLAGGTSEVLRNGLSWPISDIEDCPAYATALRTIIDHPSAARDAALKLRTTLLAERTMEKYTDLVLGAMEARND